MTRLLLPSAAEVDIWWLDLSSNVLPLTRAEAIVSAEERARAACLATSELALRFLRRRAARRVILAAYAGSVPEALNFASWKNGKPTLSGRAPAFNASQSGDMAVVVVASEPVGVDVEAIAPLPDLETVAETVLSQGERAALSQLAVSERLGSFFRSWVIKEAIAKWMGDGLSADFRHLAPGYGGSALTLLDAPRGFAAALASSRPLRPRYCAFDDLFSKTECPGNRPVSGD